MNWLRQLFSRRRRYDELSECIREHIDEKIDDLIDRGMTRDEAEKTAHREFGNVTLIEERSREVWQWPTLDSIWADIKYALRGLIKSPAFATASVLTLALGIGATTAIFTLVHTVLLKSLPVVKSSELYRVGDIEHCCINRGLQDHWSLFSVDLYKYFRDHTSSFDEIAAMSSETSPVAIRRSKSAQAAQPLVSELVSGNYFAMFGVNAYKGRTLADEDDQEGAAPVAVMSFHTWQREYEQDPSVVGSSFSINGHPFTIVGIAPPDFFGDRLQASPPSLWIPLTDDPLLYGVKNILHRPDLHWLDLIGRIRLGADPAILQSQLQVNLRQWLLGPTSGLKASERELVSSQVLRLSSGGNGLQAMQENYRSGLRLLMWISALVLALVCANLANLMLVRNLSRRQITSVRTALGASRMRLVRQALIEALVLAILGGCAGLVLAFGGTHAILYLAFHNAYVPIRATPELPILAFTFAAVLITSLLFGVAPAWMTLPSRPVERLRRANSAMRSSGSVAQRSLVVGQAALSVILLSAAAMLTVSLTNMQRQRFGFDTKHSYVLHINPLMAGYKPAQMEEFYRRLHDALTAIPGVTSVSFSISSPMDGVNWNETAYIEGQDTRPNSTGNDAYWNYISPEYFKTLGIGILRGRPIASEDTENTQRIAVVNRAFADRFFKNQNPLGKHLGFGSLRDAGDFEIVGLVENTLSLGPRKQTPPMSYLAASQAPEDGSRYLNAVEIRNLGSASDLETQVRHVMTQIDPNMPILDFQTLGDQMNVALRQQIMIARLTSLFGFLALILAVVGLYGVTAFLVEEHKGDIGIRMALGAKRSAVLALVLRDSFLQIGAGLAIGIPATILAGRAMSSQLFGVRPYDPAVLGSTVVLLGTVAVIAAIIPARRAASPDPMQALRSE
jgi:putative ABC transport system permease protein